MALVKGTSCGFVTVAPTADPSGTNNVFDSDARALKDVAPTGATAITQVGWYCDNATEESNFEVGLYSHDGTNNRPNSLLYSDIVHAKGTNAGWKVVTGLNWAITAGTTYWIAAQLDDTATPTNANYTASVGDTTCRTQGTATLPNPWVQTATGVILYGIYAVWEAGAALSLAGTTTGTVTAAAAIISSETLVATVSATGGASSSAGCAMTLIGVATAQSTGSAALSSGESTTGLVAALSTASGTVVLSGSLAGSVTCVSAASGSLIYLYPLAGLVEATSDSSGAITISMSLVSVVSCTVTASGAVKQAVKLAGIVSAVCTPAALLSTSVGGAWYKIVAAGSAGIATSQLANQATRILVSADTAGAQGIKKTSSGLTTIQTCAILSVGGKINIFLTADFAYGTSYSVTFKVYRGASQLYQWIRPVNSSNGITITKHFSDTPGAGTHTYTLQANASTPSDNQMLATACSLVLDEWKGK